MVSQGLALDLLLALGRVDDDGLVLLAAVVVDVESELLELPQATSRADAERARNRVRIVFIGGLYQSAPAMRRPALLTAMS